MADISNLIDPNKELGSDHTKPYEAPSDLIRPIPPSIDTGEPYTLVRDTSQAVEWKTTKDGNNIYTGLKFKVVGGDHDGRTFFDRIFTNVPKGFNSSSAEDYLKACGVNETPANGRRYSAQEIADLVDAVGGTQFRAKIDWNVYDAELKETVKVGKSNMRAKHFPVDPDSGIRQYIVELPARETGGKPRKLAAAATIDRYVTPETD